MQYLTFCYNINVPIYLLFQFKWTSLPSVTTWMYQFIYCSNINEAA